MDDIFDNKQEKPNNSMRLLYLCRLRSKSGEKKNSEVYVNRMIFVRNAKINSIISFRKCNLQLTRKGESKTLSRRTMFSALGVARRRGGRDSFHLHLSLETEPLVLDKTEY
ncbi:hypothetical protein CDAR_52661 [Caerostris darwini]|uniref:Uncharacterized protein n=1 Tax=Caerostris darwini TaxID=1538125 RepID=A0AAV4T5E4_9ARAC|nr:hypothetical protein CDAR_52661 [Caerostris darwini]